MAYNVSYSTLPTFTSNSIGYIQPAISYNLTNSIWFAPTEITLTPGIYYITSNISFVNSPNSYAYIILNNNSNNSIWFTSPPITYYPMDEFSYFQGTNPNTSSNSGNMWNTYTSWYPVAGQQMRNGASGSSTALSLSAIVSITANTQVTTLAYTQSGGNSCISQTCVRLS